LDLGLAGRKVLITGASRGIGEGLAHGFAAQGCAVRLVGRDEAALAAVAEAVRCAHEVEVRAIVQDMAAPDAAELLARTCPDTDILVNNAGNIPGGNLWSVDEALWRESWEAKLFGYMRLAKALYPLMRERGRGVILNDIGNAGERFDADYIYGTTANAALMAFTRALGGRSLDDGIRVIGVNPGPVATDRIVRLLKKRALDWHGDEDRWQELAERYPLKRAASVQEVVDLMLFLASARCTYMSGTIVTIDGGIVSRSSII
jgi:NAD(P)-dependent dehydrogenase (short-subunit alcohol dehydrogenase family)